MSSAPRGPNDVSPVEKAVLDRAEDIRIAATDLSRQLLEYMQLSNRCEDSNGVFDHDPVSEKCINQPRSVFDHRSVDEECVIQRPKGNVQRASQPSDTVPSSPVKAVKTCHFADACDRPARHPSVWSQATSVMGKPVRQSVRSQATSVAGTRHREFHSMVTGAPETQNIASSLRDGVDPHKRSAALPVGLSSQLTSFSLEEESCTSRFVNSFAFDVASAIAILVNAVFIGVQTDYMAHIEKHESEDVALVVCTSLFAAVFTVEFALRIHVQGFRYFYCSSNWAWNYFDFFVVLGSLTDLALSFSDQQSTADISSLRLLRLVRITRLIRVIRIARLLRFISALRDLIHAILATMKSLFWSLVLLTMILYAFGIAFTQAVLENRSSGRDIVELQAYFGSIPRSMLTLFKTITNGLSWHEVVTPLEAVGGLYVAIFLLYVSFAYFAVLNVVTSAFCSSAVEGAQKDHDKLIHNQIKHSQVFSDLIGALFEGLDVNQQGYVTRVEFVDGLRDPQIQAFLSTLDLEIRDATMLFDLLDVDNEHMITMEQFVMGCVRLKGSARSIDMARMLSHGQATLKALHSLTTKVDALQASDAETCVGCIGH